MQYNVSRSLVVMGRIHNFTCQIPTLSHNQ